MLGVASFSPTALVVPVVQAREFVADVSGMPPHVTVLYPFMRSASLRTRTLRGLCAVFAGFESFEFTLDRIGRFPGVLYIEPNPAAPFQALTRACAERWPRYQPYRGQFSEIVPHLTVVEGREPAGLADRVRQALPLKGRTDAVWLMRRGARGVWEKAAVLPLGG
jgi:2'-5' RNA ligase